MNRGELETAAVLGAAGITAANVAEAMRLARRHRRLAEADCNRELTPRERADYEERIPQRLAELLAPLPVFLSSDPRGYTVRVTLPDGRGNTSAHDGWGID